MIAQELARLKMQLLTRGVYVDPLAAEALTHGGRVPLFLNDYPTTSGLTLRFESDVYVNAVPNRDASAGESRLLMTDSGSGYEIEDETGARFPVGVLPLPAYESEGRAEFNGAFTHADRVRLSPISGCAYTCKFCDSPLAGYSQRSADDLLRMLQVAVHDPVLPARHALVSGGVPRPADFETYIRTCETIVAKSPVPVDVMLPPHDLDTVDRLVDAGVAGLSMNIEIFDEEIAERLCPSKQRLGLSGYAKAIERAVARLGEKGRVRSLLIVGLEPAASTLAGVEFIASLGCDPVLSPFRPAAGTPLAKTEPPGPDEIEPLYYAAREIAKRHGVCLGPRCIPCQHNTITLPEPGDGHYFS